MRASKMLIATLKEKPNEAVISSHILLIRAGMIRKLVAGVYNYLPLGLRVLNKIEKVIREEMENAGSLEILSSAIQPKELWEESGRWQKYGPELMRFKDRHERDFCLGPTHEEIFTDLVRNEIKSKKNLPINIYQIQTKYRDELRPRFGLMRGREFLMKDAYSFDRDLDGLDKSYKKMYEAYKNIFNRMNIDYKIVTASTGVMGGLLSEEFQAITEIGEDIVVLCDKCDFASNIEITECITNKKEEQEELKKYELLHTPNVGTIDDLVNNYHISKEKMAKTLIYKIDNKFYACMVKSNREVNEYKLLKLLNAKEISLAEAIDVEKITNAKVGFAGPINLDIPIIIDHEVSNMKNFLVGANKTNYHYINVNLNDFEIHKQADISNVLEGDSCPCCGGKLYFKKGIEIGNTFKLGTKYSESLGLTYLDEENKSHPVVMGCYGIGIGRILAAIIEQNHDDNGIILPMNIAPYQVSIVLINDKDEKQLLIANEIYENLINNGIEVILDNRNERPGVKFKDMDLIGIPIRITIGKKVQENQVELKLRNETESIDINIEDIYEVVSKIIKEHTM